MYISVYLFRVPNTHREAFLRIQREGARIKRGYGALEDLTYVVVTSFFPRSLGLVKLIVSSYPAALVPPCSRRAGDALCS